MRICERKTPCHAISGCDIVSQLFAIGKGTVLKVLKTGKKLETLGDLETEIDEIIL